MNKYDKEELEHLIFVENLSYEEIGRRYQVTGNSIKKAARKLGIELPVRRKVNPTETSNSVVDNVKQIMIIKSILTDGNQVKNKV